MPRLSIVIAVVSGSYDLDSMKRACAEADVEILLVQSGLADTARNPNGARVVRVAPDCSERAMRLAGRQEATGERVAIIGDRYDLHETWIKAAISSESEVVTGCVLPSKQMSSSGWAIYLAEYSHVASPKRHSIEGAFVVEGNVVFSRSPTAGIWFNPALAVSFARPPHLKEYLINRYRDSRNWAATQNFEHSRYVSAAARLALPALLLWRRARNVFSGGIYRRRFVASLPYLILFGMAEAAGEIVGFLAGKTQTR